MMVLLCLLHTQIYIGTKHSVTMQEVLIDTCALHHSRLNKEERKNCQSPLSFFVLRVRLKQVRAVN